MNKKNKCGTLQEQGAHPHTHCRCYRHLQRSRGSVHESTCVGSTGSGCLTVPCEACPVGVEVIVRHGDGDSYDTRSGSDNDGDEGDG